jgi:preprotein translocase subunit SecB
MAKKAAQQVLAKAPTHPLAAINERSTQSLQLRDLRLLSSSTFLNPGMHPKDLPKEVNQDIKVHCARVEAESSLIYMIDFTLKSNLENGEPALTVAVRFGLIYQFQTLEGIDDEAGQAFGQTTALFCIWPYWREFVQGMVARMGLPPIRIPLMRPTDLRFSPAPQSEGDAKKPKRSAGAKRRGK